MSYGKIFPLGGSGGSTPSGIAGAIQFSNGSAFASDAANLFWDDTNNWLGVGTNAPSATAHFKGSGTTSATSSLIVANNAGTTALEVLDDSRVKLGNSSDFTVYSGAGIVARFAMNIGSTSLPTAQLQVKGSGSTSATTSLLVQNSSGTELLKVADNGEITTYDINARVIYARANTLELRPNASGGAGSASLQGFVSGLGWLSMFTAESGKDFGQIPRGAVVNGTTINASAIFQVDSTTKGFLPPRMTTTQRDAIATPATGLKIYNTTLGTTDTYDGATWQRFGQQTFIKGSGTTSATLSFLVQNGAGTEFMRIADNGVTTFAGTVQNLGGPFAANQFYNAQNIPFIYGTTAVYGISGTTPVVTSGQRDGFLGQFTFAPTSGTAILNVLNVSPTINQTGGANGITRGLYINPTLTSAADFRAIEVTEGNVLIGNTALNTAKLSIKGSGSTSATLSLLVQNSAGNTAFQVSDNTDTRVFGALAFYNGNTFIVNDSNTLQIAAINGATSDLHLNPNRQVNINNTGSYTAQASAILQTDSTTKGFLPPRQTVAQRTAIASPAVGLMVYQTDGTEGLYIYKSTGWTFIA